MIAYENLCLQFGSPLYVYDAEIIRRQYNRLKGAFAAANTHIHYACKANNNLHILRIMHSLGAGLDTVSIYEVMLGLKAGFKPDQIVFTPNGVAMDEMMAAVEAGVHINIDNLSILEQFGEKYGNAIPICIRINPHIMGGGNFNISTGHIDSKFGISIYQMRHVQRIVDHYKMNVHGLHMHTGSDILDTDIFLRAADILFEQATLFPNLKFLDFGSGFKVAYGPNDYSTDIEELGERLTARFNAFCNDVGRALELWFEPGKFLVSESGVLLVKVNVLKQTTSAVFAGVNSGLNHLIRPMLYNAYHHISNVSNPDGKQRIYTVTGNICETDTFAYDRRIAEISEGDILAIHNAGAYGFSMSSNYNARPRPAEILVDGQELKCIRRAETFEDLLRTTLD